MGIDVEAYHYLFQSYLNHYGHDQITDILHYQGFSKLHHSIDMDNDVNIHIYHLYLELIQDKLPQIVLR